MQAEEDVAGPDSGSAPRLAPARSVDAAELDAAREQASRLCGFLGKVSGKGPLRGYKPRWFVFDPRRCYLYYFKTPQDALPLGHIEIHDAAFSFDAEGDEGQFQVRTAGKEFLLKAPTRQVMHFWLQQLQQKRWEFSAARGCGQRDSWSSPTLAVPSGLVAQDNDVFQFEKLSDSMEKVRSDFALETESGGGGVIGGTTARSASTPSTNPLNFSLRNIGTELRNSMSYLRPGRGGESRRSVFYTGANNSSSSTEDWELLEAPGKDFAEQKPHDTPRHSSGSSFTLDFGRSSARLRRPLLLGAARAGRHVESRSAESSPVEANGAKPLELQVRLQSQQEELNRLKEELASHKELVRLLQQTLRTTQSDRQPTRRPAQSPDLAADPSQDRDQDQDQPQPWTETQEKLLQDRDEQIQSLCGHMERLALEKESLQQELKGLKGKVGEINDQLGMLMETIQAKDQVIMKLSQQSSEPSGGPADAGAPPTWREQQELDVLKDSLQGYKSQNKFLNKEILELTELRRNAESRERALEAKSTALEAKLCQVESKYLVLLQEVKTPVCSSSEQSPAREVISRLLEDALQAESPETQEHPVKPSAVSEFDVFGFKTVPEEEGEEERLGAKVRALELKSLSMTDQEVSVGVKWENFLAGTMNRELVRSPELKALIRAGVPHEHRSQIWRWCVSSHVKKFRDQLAPDYYETLLHEAQDKPNPASEQIHRDLLRTLPNNKHYASPAAPGIQKLRNVLLAFSWRNPDIGYCQGLNRLAAIALLYLDQEDAFWSLIAIVEVFMPRDYYTRTLLGSQVDQRVFKDLMSEKMPRLHAHFELYEVDFSLITFNWFLVVFVDSVVSDILFKIWDAFLFEGPKIIFRFALALFKCKEEEFLKLQDKTAIYKYLICFTRTILDSRKLMNIAFVDMNPFPMKQIQNRRAFHLEKVRLELTGLEAKRQLALREREAAQDGRAFYSDDEEDA